MFSIPLLLPMSQPLAHKDTGTTTGEVAQFWNVGLRANFHGVRDPGENEFNRRHVDFAMLDYG